MEKKKPLLVVKTQKVISVIIEYCGKVESLEIMIDRGRRGKKSSAFVTFDDQDQSIRLSFKK